MLISIWPEIFFISFGIIFIVFLLCLFKNWTQIKFFLKKKEKITASQVVLGGAFVCATLYFLASFIAPYYLSVYPLEMSLSSNMANSIYGLMSPFIAIAAAILTFMAFWVQYNANQNIYRDNKKQQDERQFYEMLKIHRDNVDKMEYVYSGTEEMTSTRSPIKITLPIDSYDKTQIKYSTIRVKGQAAIRHYLNEFSIIYKNIPADSKKRFEKSYSVFFNGLDNCSYCSDKEKEKLKKIKQSYDHSNTMMLMFLPSHSIMEGRKTILNPYYRHLYLTVKSIVDSNFEKKEKEKYLKTLRASLTAEEQALLLFNWFYGKLRGNGYGIKWEIDDVVNGKYCKQNFFTEWKMIHNVVRKDFQFVEEMSTFEKLGRLVDPNLDVNNYDKLRALFEEA